jgi:aminoglycoside 3-N-acetyltransferase
MSFPALRLVLNDLLPRESRPVVAYSGVWPLATAFDGDRASLVNAVRSELLGAVGSNRTLVMPTYTGGFKNGIIDLDQAPGMTGVLNEAVRTMAGSRRTASAFFSFTARGPEAEALAALRPTDAWGDGSLFDWIESQDAHIVLLGVPLPMCSFLHRVEWLARVPYRYLKEFSGEMVLEGRKQPLRERLFVRSLDPLVENIWTGAEDLLGPNQFRRAPLGRGWVSVVGAKALLETLLPVVRRNPFAFVKNADLLREHFSRPDEETRR